MRKMKCLAVLASVMGMVLMGAGPALAAEAALVKIQPVGDDKLIGMYVDPPVLYVDQDTVVIWMSGVPEEDVQVVFSDGKACKDVTANPMGFSLNNKDCYVTSFISYAGTSSLQFPEEGRFDYVVETQDGKVKAKGKLIVR